MSYEGKNSRQDGYYGTNAVIIAAIVYYGCRSKTIEMWVTLYRFSQIRIRNLSWAGLIHISRKLVLSKKKSLKFCVNKIQTEFSVYNSLFRVIL